MPNQPWRWAMVRGRIAELGGSTHAAAASPGGAGRGLAAEGTDYAAMVTTAGARRDAARRAFAKMKAAPDGSWLPDAFPPATGTFFVPGESVALRTPGTYVTRIDGELIDLELSTGTCRILQFDGREASAVRQQPPPATICERQRCMCTCASSTCAD